MSKGISLVAIRYARSLVALSEANHHATSDSYKKVFDKLEELFSIPEATAILKSPVMPNDLKFNLLQLAIQSNADHTFTNFIKNLLEADRVNLIPEIAASYEVLLTEKRNEKKAKITSAHPLSADAIHKIEKQLTDLFGKKVLLTREVDKKLLGGFVVQVENYLLDYSLRSKVDASMK